MKRYILAEITQGTSRISGGDYWTLTWVNERTLEVSQTHVDSSMTNFDRWLPVIHNPEPWGIYTGLKSTSRTTNRGFPVITADAPPSCVNSMTQQEMLQVLRGLAAQIQPEILEVTHG
jgi:hypothetical protein